MVAQVRRAGNAGFGRQRLESQTGGAMGIRRALLVALLGLAWTGVLDPATRAPACAEPACRV